MPFTDLERKGIYASCTRYFGHRPQRPVADRLREMAESDYAQLNSDHYGNGGAVAELEAHVAGMMGKEAAVFMPSGTMAQQIALRIWCDRAGEPTVAFHPTCHLEIHEQGAYRELHHLNATLLGDADRLFNLSDLEALKMPPSALLIELPQREIGGPLPTWEELLDFRNWAVEHDVKLHLDGARLWECQPFYGRSYTEISGLFDSVYVSFYKILGGLPGAMLLGPADFIAESKVWQRRHGGNLFSLAPNAIAAKIGLDRELPRIPEYCAKAAEVAAALKGLPGLRVVPEAPPTNMMHFHFQGDLDAIEDAFWQVARDSGTFLLGKIFPTDNPTVGKAEHSITAPGLEIETGEIQELFSRVL
jgi:threonine aldolase